MFIGISALSSKEKEKYCRTFPVFLMQVFFDYRLLLEYTTFMDVTKDFETSN